MSPDLDNNLCSKYPELFRDRNGSPRHTAMCWGFDCGNGWYSLIESICEYLMSDVNRLRDRIESDFYTAEAKEIIKQELVYATINIPVVVQVKEKFGGLRFYTHGASEDQSQYIHFAENLSYRICEECGAMKDVMTYNIGWAKSLCPEHGDKLYGEDVAANYRNGGISDL